ncbi:putative helicase mov-10-B.1 isoform X2 [Scleropages formosus]|uniref:putative helicase mov-10-B.1 isoform X2 n=1 Tax=Scleropages formosus TaxID=113540 RepID=UPI0008781B9E|nr:helicase MOV-10 isoform X2 [Scleropages formosus]
MAPTLRASADVGLDFIKFLEETNRKSTTDKNKLRDIYNAEFRSRDGVKNPNFSRVLYALVKFRGATVRAGVVRFTRAVQLVSQDQWRRPQRQNQSNASPSLPADATPIQAADADSAVRSRKRLGHDILRNLKEKSDYVANKKGIEITSDHNTVDGKIFFCVQSTQETTYTIKLYVSNRGTSPVYFTDYIALQRMRSFTLRDERNVSRTKPLLLSPDNRHEVLVEFHIRHYGFFPATLAFEFHEDSAAGRHSFHIVRFIEAQYQTVLAKDLAPAEPFKPITIASYKAIPAEIVDGGEPPDSFALNNLKTVEKLDEYKISGYLWDLVNFLKGQSYPGPRDQILSNAALLESPLSFQNYKKKFQLLLHLEEKQMEMDIRRYDMHNVIMTQDRNNKKLLVLHVPGVAENRPSVLRGDYLLASKAGDTEEPATMYKGYVHKVELEQVKLSFPNKLLKEFVNNMRFNIRFTINRFLMQLQHRAVELAVRHQLEEVLFPAARGTVDLPLTPLRLFDRCLEQNPEQYTAVRHIVSGVSRPAPYLVFGPPGTGKTVTLVEAIKQVEEHHPSAHILASAPSNSATDLLCDRLLTHVDAHKVYRLYASSRNPDDVPSKLLGCCNWDQNQGCFVFPSKEKLMEYKILVTTVFTAGRLVSGGLPPGHFTYIFVDEAGHAAEPECIIGIAGLLHPKTGQLVLAGDPKQLGPILRSPFAINYGLGLSLLERLMTTNPLYKKDANTGHLDNRFVTKLLRNYRSHPAILKIPNELFYDDELEVFANEVICNSYCRWEYLPKKGFPVIFHGVTGKDEREGNSPSFFNTTEIEVLVDYLKKLLQTQGKKGLATISPREIGIIAPYRKQVEKIQQAVRTHDKDLRKLNDIKELKVGVVEEFQGQERKVIMVSTVRSSGNYVKMDQDFRLGFLNNEKRFNVAITRAKALLIVVGNPIILNMDKTWRRFIQYCSEETGYTGINYRDAKGEDDIIDFLVNLHIGIEPTGSKVVSLLPSAPPVETEESMIQQHVDPEWKREQ